MTSRSTILVLVIGVVPTVIGAASKKEIASVAFATDAQRDSAKQERAQKKPGIFASISSAFLSATGNVASLFFPSGKQGERIVKHVAKDEFFTKKFPSDDAVVRHVRRRYLSTRYPLVLAMQKIDRHRKDLNRALQYFDRDIKGAKTHDDYYTSVVALRERAEDLFDKASFLADAISSQPAYEKQCDRYELQKLSHKQLDEHVWYRHKKDIAQT